MTDTRDIEQRCRNRAAQAYEQNRVWAGDRWKEAADGLKAKDATIAELRGCLKRIFDADDAYMADDGLMYPEYVLDEIGRVREEIANGGTDD